MTSKVKGQGREVTWSILQMLARKFRTKSHRNTKIGRKIAFPMYNKAHQFQGQKRSKVKVTRLINAEIKSVSPTNFKLCRRLEYALSTAIVSYKGL